ncbi:MAG TPA: creatininase family protein [bacterium]|nr:creatininase family protein [bacterium]
MSNFNLSGILEEMTTEDVKKLDPNLGIIPIGSTEPHGPALPYGTDSFSIEAKCCEATKRANSNGAKVICLPVQKIALNNNFYGLPFACRISVPVFMAMVKDIVHFLREEGINRVFIANGHGGNTDVLKAVQRDMSKEKGLFLGLLEPGPALPKSLAHLEDKIEHRSPRGEEHGGEWETSNMLFLKPGLVRKDRIGNQPVINHKIDILNDCNVHFVKPWHVRLPNAAGGDSRKASLEKARIIFEAGVKAWAELFAVISQAPESENFPY